MWASLKGYLRSPLYRLSLVTALVAGAATYIVIGFAPTLFVDRGITLTVVGVLIGVGRLISVGGKFVSGWAYDRFGGPRSAQWIMFTIAICGVPLVALARGWGVIAVVPFVLIVSCLFPISNALSVAGLPERSTWGIGVYRGLLVGSSALLAGIVGLLLDHLSLNAVMYGSLLLPLAGGRRRRHDPRRVVDAVGRRRIDGASSGIAYCIQTTRKDAHARSAGVPQCARGRTRRVPLEEPPVLQDLGCR